MGTYCDYFTEMAPITKRGEYETEQIYRYCINTNQGGAKCAGEGEEAKAGEITAAVLWPTDFV